MPVMATVAWAAWAAWTCKRHAVFPVRKLAPECFNPGPGSRSKKGPAPAGPFLLACHYNSSSMYRKCPKCAHERAPQDDASADVCPNCGLIFSKYMRARFAAQSISESNDAPGEGPAGLIARVNEHVFHVADDVKPVHVYARAALLAMLVIYGIRLARMDIPSWEMAGSLIHLPMVPIHEFGHVMFRAFGDFMHSLGGSLFQIVLPLVFGGVFLLKNRDPFAAAAMLWWSAVALMDVAPYVYDALHPQHVLLTGRTGDDGPHDFIDVLSDLGVLKSAQTIGYGVHRFGVLLLLVAFAWAGWIVWQQYRVAREA